MDENNSLASENAGAIIPIGPPPADTVTIKMIDRVSEPSRFVEYDMSPSATIEDLKNKISAELKYKPSHFNILTPRQMVLNAHTPLGGLEEAQPLFLLKTAIAKLDPNSTMTYDWMKPTPVYGPQNISSGFGGSNFDWNAKSSTGFCGLSNQGATCYMNSLIQTLYMTPEFRTAIYSWDWNAFLEKKKELVLEKLRADAAKEGKPIEKSEEEIVSDIESRSIPRQLQKLFTRLQFSSERAVSTKSLTKSFGWSDADAFTQHDVQELCRVLFDAIEQSFKGTKNEDIINLLYQGEMKDYVKCKVCGHESKRSDFFLDIPLVIRAFGAAKAIGSIEEALESFSQPETLDGDNQYNCEKCDKKVDALKGLALVKLPYFLTLQLKRFDFDYERLERVKLDDRVTFPLTLDMRPYIESNLPEDQQIPYELFSVLIHRGSSMAGHYYAYIKSFEKDKWFEFNDSMVSSITADDIKKTFGENSTFYSTSGNAYMLMYRKVDENKNKNAVTDEEVPIELRNAVEKDNKKTKEKEEKEKEEKDMCKLKVLLHSQKKKLQVSRSKTIDEIMDQLKALFGLESVDNNLIRLRALYSDGVPGEALDSSKTMYQLGFSTVKRVFLEMRKEDEEFSDPKHSSYRVRAYNKEKEKFDSCHYVFVPENLPLGELKLTLEKVFGIPKENQRITWASRHGTPQELTFDENTWNRDIRDGSILYLEPADISPENLALREIEKQQTMVTIVYNVPPSEEKNNTLSVNKEITLMEFREKMQKLVNIPLFDFRMFRVSYPSKLEITHDPRKQLGSYFPGAGDKIDKVYTVAIELGKPKKEGEVLLNLYHFKMDGLIDDANGEMFTHMFEFMADGEMKVSEMKEFLAKKLKEDKNIEVDPKVMRLRDSVAICGYREPYTIYLDNQLLKEKHPYSGRGIAFQMLSEPEPSQAGDLSIFIQRWQPSEFKVGVREEVLLHPQNVAEDLRQHIIDKYEIPSEHLAIARVYNMWGVVKLLELAGIKWDTTSRVCPRDGDLVFWCDTREELKELTAEEKKQIQKATARQGRSEKALTIQVQTN